MPKIYIFSLSLCRNPWNRRRVLSTDDMIKSHLTFKGIHFRYTQTRHTMVTHSAPMRMCVFLSLGTRHFHLSCTKLRNCHLTNSFFFVVRREWAANRMRWHFFISYFSSALLPSPHHFNCQLQVIRFDHPIFTSKRWKSNYHWIVLECGSEYYCQRLFIRSTNESR